MTKKGYKQTDEHKKKVSLALKGKFKGISHVQRMGEERAKLWKEHFSKTRIGYKCLDSTKIKIGIKNKGKILGKTWEERFTKEYIINRKKKLSETMKKFSQRPWEARYGDEKAKEIRKERKRNWIERFGVEKSTILKEIYKEKRKLQITPLQDTKIEIKIQSFLKELNVNFYTHQYCNEIQHSYQCDIFIPIYNLIIECDGNYWHNYPTGKEVDHIRTNELIEKGFNVLRLWESEIKTITLEEFSNKLKIYKESASKARIRILEKEGHDVKVVR